MVDLVTKIEVIQNETLLISYLSKVGLENITAFLIGFSSVAEKANLTQDQVDTVKKTLLAVELKQLQSRFSTYAEQEWKVLFENHFKVLIQYFNQTLLQLLPINISCASYQAIVKGFSLGFNTLNNATKRDIYNYFIKIYLANRASSGEVACDTVSYDSWLTLNFGKFTIEATYEELSIFNKNLTKLDNAATLTPTNLADFTITADLINNATLTTITINKVKQFRSLIELSEYVVKLQSYVCSNSSSPSDTTLCASSGILQNSNKSAIFLAVSEVLMKYWNSSSQQEWLENFRIIVNMFSLEMTELTISQLPKDITCDTAKGIISSMNSSFGLFTSNIQKAAYQYLLGYHKKNQMDCDKAGDLQLFITTYFEASSALISPGDLISLIPSEKLSTKLNSLEPQDLVYYLQPETNKNVTLWSTILSHYSNISKLGKVWDLLNIKMVESSLFEIVFKIVWPTFVSSSGSIDDSEIYDWFNVRFNSAIKFITLEQLNITTVINANCTFYQALVQTLSRHYGDYSNKTQQDIYNVLKMYLQSGDKPKCYREGNDSWMYDNLNVYLTYCSAGDLMSFSNETMLQQFSVDNKTLNLIKTLTLQEDLKVYYAQLLTTQDPNLPLTIIPQNILCYAIANLNIGNIAGNEALTTLSLLKTCNYSSSATEDINAVSSLLSSLPVITSNDITSLGPLAVGLPTSTILENINGSILVQSISALSSVSGWSVTQASAIVSKIINSKYEITAENLKHLGSLVIGLSSSNISTLNSTNILQLAADSKFTTYMEQAPVTLKQRFVMKIIQGTYIKTIFETVPANLASEIPASNLLISSFNISLINQMKWTPSQAQVFFKTVLTQVTDYSTLSSNILQGFTCGAAHDLNDDQFVSLIKSMTGKSVSLESSQLNCLAKRLTKNGAPTDYSSYPSDVLLYIGPYTEPSVCQDYFTRVGKANINLLAQGSGIALLNSARTCLKIESADTITKANLQILGNLVCDLTDQEIIKSDSFILEALKSCSSFTDLQKQAILQKLTTTYGASSSWTVSTMKQIGSLSSILDSSTFNLINKDVKRQFLPGFLTSMKMKYKTVFTTVLKQLKARSSTRAAADCEELTTDLIAKQRDYIVVTYTATQLDACLSNVTLRDNLDTLGSLAFYDDQLNVLKKKLDTVYPTSLAEEYLIQLGNIAPMYSIQEISRWSITQVDTLAALLNSASWNTNDSKIDALVKQYLSTPNVTFDGTSLTILAPYICGLNETLIGQIPYIVFRKSSQPLDITLCTQSKKDLLFSKMKAAYSSSQKTLSCSNAYYQIMKTVIGGAKSEDIQCFATAYPDMDLSTFTGLNPAEVKMITAENIKDLLGNNFVDLNTISSSAVIQAWLSVNTQVEINKLGLNVTSGVTETMPNGFIVFNPVTQTSGVSSHSFVYLLYLCALTTILNVNVFFL
ncbi:hypothetical protein GDO81_020882 [Engystomops pustulosus]|uniref:Mesothelin-like protein n=1 Tax=Engystomops pustulosus TaxID=76066 RepID=A0AAV6ZAR8_ENGPU|nr:hypothetical protein GDO81_020882 [Engystomops pustulosus]